MASEVGDLYVVLRAVTDPFKKSLKDAAAEGEASTTAIGGAFQRLAQVGAVAGTAAVAIGSISVKWAADFQTQMTRLYTAAGLSNQMLKAAHMSTQQLDDAVLQLGNQTGYTGTQMAEALYHPISAGLDLKSALQVVKYAAEEAQISGASLDDTTYSLSSVMKAFNKSAGDAGPTMADLNAIVGEGDMRFQDFNQSIKNWAPTAAQMGISINSMGAGLAYLTDRGNSAEVASTRLTMGISMMTTPSAQAAKMLEGLGLASSDVSASSSAMEAAMKKANITQNQLAVDLKQPDGLYVALKDLKDGLEKAGVSGTEADSVLAKIFGGGRSDKAIMSLMQNLDGLKTKYDAISHDSSMSHFQDAWQKTQQTFNAQLHQTEATLVNLGIKIGTILLPYVEKFLGWVRVGVDWLIKHKGAAEALAGALGVTLVAAIVAVGGAFVAMFGEAEAIALGIMALGAALVYAYAHFKTFRTIVNDVASFLWGALKLAFAGAVLAIHAFRDAWDVMAKAVHAIVKWFDQNVLSWIKARIADLTAWWHAHADEITAVWRVAFGLLATIATVWWDGTMKPLLSALSSVWRVTWGILRDTAVLAWRIVSSVVTTGIHLLLNTVGVVLDLITGHWSRAWSDMKHLASQSFWDVVHAIESIAGGFGNLLYDAGRNIIQGLINGIWSMVGNVGSAMSSITSWISGFLPHSPAKRGPLSGSGSPDLAGAKIGSMLADGMRSSIVHVGRASSQLAGAASLAVDGSWSGGGSLAALAAGAGVPNYADQSSGQPIIVQVDGKTLFQIMQTHALRYGRRNPTTGLTYTVS